MFTLVESLGFAGLNDTPDLGCAMLLASCKARGIKATFVKGQTFWLKNAFMEDADELWDLLHNLDAQALAELGLPEFTKRLRGHGRSAFQSNLKSLYTAAFIDKNPRDYYDAFKAEGVFDYYKIHISVYKHYVKELNIDNLRIIDRYVDSIMASDPRCIGFSMQPKFDVVTRAIQRRIREATDIPIILGGTLTPFIDDLERIFEREPVDYINIGPGEHSLPLLIEAIEQNREDIEIPGVYYQRGREIIGIEPEAITDLDALPFPDFSQFDLDSYPTPERILPIQTGRGCTWRKCAFCCHSAVYFGNYRTWSIGRLIATLKHLEKSYQCTHFAIHDEELPAPRARAIAEALIGEKMGHLGFHAMARLTRHYNDAELVEKLYKAGFYSFGWGLESGCQKTLEAMHKGTQQDIIRDILRKTSRAGILNLCFIMFGFPSETLEDAEQTVSFLQENADYIDLVMLSTFTLCKHALLLQEMDRFDLTINKDGSYINRTGMSMAEANRFAAVFMEKQNLGAIKVSSQKFAFHHEYPINRTQHYLRNCHHPIPNREIDQVLETSDPRHVFPMLLGTIEEMNGDPVLVAVDVTKPPTFSRIFSMQRHPINRIEELAFRLSDGTLSIHEIISTIAENTETEGMGEREIRRQSLDFIGSMISADSGFAFAKSWR